MKTLKNSQLQIEIDEATLTADVRDLRTGRLWRMQPDGPGDVGLRGHAGPYQGMRFDSALDRKWEVGEDRASVTVFKWPYSAHVWTQAAFGVTVHFILKDDALRVELEPYRPLHGEISLIDSYYPRGFLFPERLGGKLVLPFGQGTLLDKNYPVDLDMVQPGYVGIGFVMPWFGQLADDGSGLIALSDTPDDLAFRIKTEPGRGVTVHPYWLPQLGALKYKRVMTYQFFQKTSVLELAKRYRRHAETLMAVQPLKEKAKERPGVESLRGGMQVALWAMSTFRNKAVYGDFSACFQRYRRVMEGAGVKKAIAHIDGWGKDGYDYNHPDVLPPDERLGGWPGLKTLAENIRKMGHAVLLHDNYVDYYMHTAAFKNQDGNMDLGGERPESLEWLGGPQQWLCAQKAPFYAKRNFAELQEKIGLQGIYVDCWTIGHLRECFDQRHLSTRTMTREAWSSVFTFCQKMGWLTSSESGNDWAVPTMDYCHTVQPDVIPHGLRGIAASFGQSIPLYEMVWHDCVTVPGCIGMEKIAANIREGCVVEEKHDMRLWTLLWCGIPSFGTPSLDLAVDKPGPADVSDEIAFVKQLKLQTDFSAAAGFEPLTHWEGSPDGTIQTSVFGDDATVTVDFKRRHYKIAAPGMKTEGNV